MNKYLGSYGSSIVIKSTIEFVESTKIENEFNQCMPENAVRFAHYFRLKTGVPETFAHFIFPNDMFPEHQYRKFYLPAMPALCDIVNFTNDVLSFYKESIRGSERANYICNVAKTTGKSALQCLYDLNDGIEHCVAEVRRILQPHPALLAHANDYLTGSIGWHFYATSRYHLDEIENVVEIFNQHRRKDNNVPQSF